MERSQILNAEVIVLYILETVTGDLTGSFTEDLMDSFMEEILEGIRWANLEDIMVGLMEDIMVGMVIMEYTIQMLTPATIMGMVWMQNMDQAMVQDPVLDTRSQEMDIRPR